MRTALVLALALALPLEAAAQAPFSQLLLEPIHDTWASPDDGIVHGAEPQLKVGIEPKACGSVPGYDPCPKDELVCCDASPALNYCAPEGECATTDPVWKTFRKFRVYLRFDLSGFPADAKLVKATLSLRQGEVTQKQGSPPNIEAHRLKSIGFDPAICAWSEATLKDSNGTTWSSLVQNLSVADDGTWSFDVTKAVRDWTTGDTDLPDQPIAPNCGFMIDDTGFGKPDAPIERWVVFSSKEGDVIPQLTIELAHDLDKDGHYADTDCDETDPLIHPGAQEVCDTIDQNCNGLVDEETCDNVDNDCDGAVDESAWCPEGTACLAGTCQATCNDDCSGPFDKTCWLGEDGIWQKVGCGQADADPCFDWVAGPKCPMDWSCGYGSCSSNCLDAEGCAEAGDTLCLEVSPDQWATTTCDEGDGDPCLDHTAITPCGTGDTCSDGECAGEACTDDCVPGDTECTGGEVRTCWKWGDAPCATWSTWVACDEGACAGWVCAGPSTCECTEPVLCEDGCAAAGETVCAATDDEAFLTCADLSGDGCLEWGPPESCPAQTGCLEGECVPLTPPEPSADVQPPAEPPPPVEPVVEEPPDPPVPDADPPAEDLGPPAPDAGPSTSEPAPPSNTGATPAADPAPSTDDSEDGDCHSTDRGQLPAGPALALLLLLAALLRRRTTALALSGEAARP